MNLVVHFTRAKIHFVEKIEILPWSPRLSFSVIKFCVFVCLLIFLNCFVLLPTINENNNVPSEPRVRSFMSCKILIWGMSCCLTYFLAVCSSISIRLSAEDKEGDGWDWTNPDPLMESLLSFVCRDPPIIWSYHVFTQFHKCIAKLYVFRITMPTR